ncbi:MAG: AbrB/MazE/SpoVT family DNA-binding domain-containing protein [Candidatus Nanoarchaeia archaeon]|nr:AbrB/MazE/SpoVT family DNA-binding domain-containing protein [Candidatus Nanoarchaeia archaeon]
MKCGICKSEMKKQLVEHRELGVSLGRFPAMVCSKCNERFYDSATVDKIQAASKKAGIFGMANRVKAAKIGNSIAIRVPKGIAEAVHLKPGMDVVIHPEEGRMVVEVL